MHYRHAAAEDHTALSPGTVLVSAPGHPAFPVRLGIEILGRCLDHLGADARATLWDPCCGSGALVTALGLAWRDRLAAVVASDVSPEALALARRNLALLSGEGLAARRAELERLQARHGKESHRSAGAAAHRLSTDLDRRGGDLPVDVESADVLDPAAVGALARRARPDVVVTDVPYGRQTDWVTTHGRRTGPDALLTSLAAALEPHAVIAVVVQGRRVPIPGGARAVERFRSGHRSGVIVRAGDVSDAAVTV